MEKEEMYFNILKENWLHMRHQETQRMWIANIFVAIVVGTSAYLTTSGNYKLEDIPIFIPVIFLVISTICFLITLKLNKVFVETKNSTKRIFNKKKISLGKGVNWRNYTGMLESEGIWRALRVRYLYVFLYGISIATSLSLLVYVCVKQ